MKCTWAKLKAPQEYPTVSKCRTALEISKHYMITANMGDDILNSLMIGTRAVVHALFAIRDSL